MAYTYRPATEADVQALTDIYNAAVIEGGSSADTTPRTVEQRRAWLESHREPYAVFVTEADGDDGNREVVGFSALSVFYDRAGYDGVTDLAYYIAPGWRGRGVGTFTLSSLLDEARQRHMRKAHHLRRQRRIHRPDAPLRIHPVRPDAGRGHRLHRHHARHELLVPRPVGASRSAVQ